MRLIDVDALIENLEYDVELDARALDDADFLIGINRDLAQFDKDCKQNAIDMLKKAPTVDAEPVRHGRLINAHPYGECSCCGVLIDSRDRFRYCPHCGAKLDGDKHDSD